MSAHRSAIPTWSAKLRDEILAVIAKHMQIDRDKVSVKMERGAKVSTLEVDIEIPFEVPKKKAA